MGWQNMKHNVGPGIFRLWPCPTAQLFPQLPVLCEQRACTFDVGILGNDFEVAPLVLLSVASQVGTSGSKQKAHSRSGRAVSPLFFICFPHNQPSSYL